MQNYILIIDDDKVFQREIRVFLESRNYRVKESSPGMEPGIFLSTERGNGETASLIVLNYLMSGDMGKRVYQKLKSNECSSSIPMILIGKKPRLVSRIDFKRNKTNDEREVNPYYFQEIHRLVRLHTGSRDSDVIVAV